MYLEDFRNQGIEGLGLQLVQLIIADTADLGRSALALVNQAYQVNELQGKQEGQAELVIHLLVRRFGMLDRLIISDIRQLSLDRLESLADVLLDLDSEADVRDWLDRI